MKNIYEHESLAFQLTSETKRLIEGKQNVIYSECENFAFVYNENDIKCMEDYWDYISKLSYVFERSFQDDFYDRLVYKSREPGEYFHYYKSFSTIDEDHDTKTIKLKENEFGFAYIYIHSLEKARTSGSKINLSEHENSFMYFKKEILK